MSCMASAMGWYYYIRVNRTILSRAWYTYAMARVVGKDTPSGAVSVAASANEGVAPLTTMTWCWSARDFSTSQTAEVCWPSPN